MSTKKSHIKTFVNAHGPLLMGRMLSGLSRTDRSIGHSCKLQRNGAAMPDGKILGASHSIF